MLTLKEVIAHLKELKREAFRLNERRLVIFGTHEDITYHLASLLDPIRKKDEKILVVTDEDENGILLAKYCKKFFKADTIFYKETSKTLGTTYDYLIMDIRHNLNPDDFGRLIDIVRGGGLIFIISYPIDEIASNITRFHRKLLISKYTEKDLKMYFTKRFVRKIFEHQGISIIEIKNEKFELLKNGLTKKTQEIEKKKIIFPTKRWISNKIYRVAITQDEVNVIKLLEDFWLENKKSIFILKANRGRGKSAAIGIFLSGLIHKFSKLGKKFSIGITAPEKENIMVLLNFLKIGLEKMKLKFVEKQDEIELFNGRIVVEYRKPIRIIERYYDLVVVDEAAAIPLQLLFRIAKQFYKTIFSSTIHGYEGAGRSFSVRFMKGVKTENIGKVFEYSMKEPIRYSEDDEIEKWLFDTLLLDAEPTEISGNDAKDIALGNLIYEKPNLEEWFEKDESSLRQFFGIYVLAHYRNRPRDIAILADSPHHFPRCIRTKTDKHIINSIHVCEEGELSDEELEKVITRELTPRGNIIPSVLARHYRKKEIGYLRGWRIVRIATHPELFGMGIGTKALEFLTEEAKENGLDWIGAAFGATSLLLKFWIRNGFIPLHIATERNTTSGEYSVIVFKPLSNKAKKIAKELSYEFRLRIISSLMDVHFDLDVDTAYYLLTPFFDHLPHYKLELTEMQKERMEGFLLAHLPYESAADVCREISKYYFLDSTSKKPELSEKVKKIIILKCFLVKSWKKVANEFEMKKRDVIEAFRNAMKKIWEYYV